MIFNLNNILMVVNIFVIIIRCEENENKTTVETIFIDTTTEYVTIVTDIPVQDHNAALNIDYGRYTTQSFAYFNSQFDTLPGIEIIPCFDRHIRCLVTVVVPHPVCAINIPWDLYEGYRTFDTYCDAYLDNCLRRMRFWRTIDFGVCVVDWSIKQITVDRTRRMNPTRNKNVFNRLTNKYTKI